MDFITGSAGMPCLRALNGFEVLKMIPTVRAYLSGGESDFSPLFKLRE